MAGTVISWGPIKKLIYLDKSLADSVWPGKLNFITRRGNIRDLYMKIGVVIVAAGRGERAGGSRPKQYRDIAGRPVLARTLDAFLDHKAIGPVVTVIAEDAGSEFKKIGQLFDAKLECCIGGESRTQSVYAGLKALERHNLDAVMIHDGARPFVSDAQIDALVQALKSHEAVLPALPSTNALMRLDENNTVDSAVNRDSIYAAQTPQCFQYKSIVDAYQACHANTRASGAGMRLEQDWKASGASLDGVPAVALNDDVAVAIQNDMTVFVIPGDPDNFKLTTPEDFQKAEFMLKADKAVHASDIVTGQGYDVHRLEPADAMWLCGVKIEDSLGLVGHSDADVALHALTDAILGAAGAGDIGQHFPPSDAKWKNANSSQFVEHALSLLNEAGGHLNHADITIIGEKPKIGPHRDAMKKRVAELLKLSINRVNIKATTTEGLGFTGRGEGLAAQAIVTASMA